MPDPSNPTNRVMDVLNFLAAHPTESFTLAEIARHVGLSNGSAHRLLTAMAAGRYLSRNEKHRTYSLGLALIAIGQAAIEKHRGVDVARREIGRLSSALNVQCSANAVVDDDIVVLIKEGATQSRLSLTRVGERRPLVPPVGICHVAWGGEAAIAAYTAKADAHFDEAMREHLRATFPLVRQRGYATARQATVLPAGQVRDSAYWASVFTMVGQLTAAELQLFDLADVGERGFSYIAAPVFSPAGTVAFQLVISGLPQSLSVTEAERYAEQLCATAALITSETHGRRPDD
jgi:DNA-binding IclR family transcriptional regulator